MQKYIENYQLTKSSDLSASKYPSKMVQYSKILPYLSRNKKPPWLGSASFKIWHPKVHFEYWATFYAYFWAEIFEEKDLWNFGQSLISKYIWHSSKWPHCIWRFYGSATNHLGVGIRVGWLVCRSLQKFQNKQSLSRQPSF